MLANYFQCKVIIIQQGAGGGGATRLFGSLFQPGWEPQTLIRKPAVKKLVLIKEEPVVVIYLDYPPTHYEACVRSTDAPLDGRQMRESTKYKSTSSVIELLD
mgnify:CR=1 FL=1